MRFNTVKNKSSILKRDNANHYAYQAVSNGKLQSKEK